MRTLVASALLLIASGCSYASDDVERIQLHLVGEVAMLRSNEPIAGASVSLVGEYFEYPEVITPLAQTTTGEDGQFSMQYELPVLRVGPSGVCIARTADAEIRIALSVTFEGMHRTVYPECRSGEQDLFISLD